MNTEFNKVSILNITSFDFASFDKLRMNGINQSFLKFTGRYINMNEFEFKQDIDELLTTHEDMAPEA